MNTDFDFKSPLGTWIRWLAANFLAGALSVSLTSLVFLFPNINQDRWTSFVLFPGLCIFTGLAQAKVLARWGIRLPVWMAVTLAGWFLTFILIWLSAKYMPIEWEWTNALTMLSFALATGIVQWLVLRRRFPLASLWLLATFAGWLLLRLYIGNSFSSLVQLTAFGLIPATMTGLVLGWWAYKEQK